MIYTIIEDLLPSNHIYEDVFNDDSYIIDNIEVATVPDGSGGTLSATIDNRWEWTDSPSVNFSATPSTSGNRLRYTVNKSTIPDSTYFDYTHGITAPYGIFPIAEVVSGFSPTFQVESLFSTFSVPSGSSVSANVCTYTPGIFLKVGTDNYCTLKIIYDLPVVGVPGTVELKGEVFSFSGVYYSYLAHVTLPAPPVIGIGLRITYRNKMKPLFEYSIDGASTWIVLYDGSDYGISADIDASFSYKVTGGLFFATSLPVLAGLWEITSNFEYFKAGGFQHAETTSKILDGYYSGTVSRANPVILENNIVGTDEVVSVKQLNPGTLPDAFPITSYIYSTPTAKAGTQGAFCKLKLDPTANSAVGIFLYFNPSDPPVPSPLVTTSYIFIYLYALTATSVSLRIKKCVTGVVQDIYSNIITDDINDFIELGAGYDNFDSSFWVWTGGGTTTLINIQDLIFRVGYTGNLANVAFTQTGAVELQDCALITLPSRRLTGLTNDYIAQCAGNTSLSIILAVQKATQELKDSLVSTSAALAAVQPDFDSVLVDLATVGSSVGIDVDTMVSEGVVSVDIKQSLLDAGLEVIGGVPLLEGTDLDITGYKKLYELLGDWELINATIDNSDKFIFIVTEPVYEDVPFIVAPCNTINISGDAINSVNNCSSSVDTTVGSILYGESEIIGEKVVGINQPLSTLDVLSRYALNIYVFWIYDVYTDIYTMGRLRYMEMPTDLIFKAINLDTEDEEDNLEAYLLSRDVEGDLGGIWGDLGDEAVTDILENSELGTLTVPDNPIIALQLMQQALASNPDISSSDLFSAVDLPKVDLRMEDVLDETDEEEENLCNSILILLDAALEEITALYTALNATISPRLNEIADTWSLFISVVNTTTKIISTTNTLNIPNLAGAIGALASTITNAVTSFSSYIATFLTLGQKAKVGMCIFEELLGLLNDIGVYDVFPEEELSNILLCPQPILDKLFQILDTFTLFVNLLITLIKSILEKLVSLEFEFPNIPEMFGLLPISFECGALTALLLKFVNTIKANQELYLKLQDKFSEFGDEE